VISILFLVFLINEVAFLRLSFQHYFYNPSSKLVSPSSEGLKRVLYDHKLPFI
jgi:hypothetical protein